jgi:hypothetical protein
MEIEQIFIKIGSYLLTAGIGAALWIWRESAKKAKEESNIHSALEALKLQIHDNKAYFDEKILRLERDLKEQKDEKKELENKIYVRIQSVEGLVTKSNEDLNHIKIMVTKIATIQGMEK